MESLAWYQYAAIGLIFVWSGFVRSGLGFGGAVLALPFLLLIVNDPLVFLPLIAAHLIFFSTLIMIQSTQKQGTTQSNTINWRYLRRSMGIMIVPKIAGVIGLLTLPPVIMSTIIFLIVIAYAIGYIINRPIQIKTKFQEYGFLGLGAYVSGTSLTGAPLIIPVVASHVEKHELRNTLFILWWILTLIKLASFVVAGIDLQLVHHLWLLPCAFVGHLLGNRMHNYLIEQETPTFFRVLGIALVIVSLTGLIKPLLFS
ncbi:MAG: permease [Gammaproteobacteria bacterium]|nr:permease [Gammaproteobacteria bacterium]OUX79859.1 MAG: permease [Oceanospirillales bacterium TMED59]